MWVEEYYDISKCWRGITRGSGRHAWRTRTGHRQSIAQAGDGITGLAVEYMWPRCERRRCTGMMEDEPQLGIIAWGPKEFRDSERQTCKRKKGRRSYGGAAEGKGVWELQMLSMVMRGRECLHCKRAMLSSWRSFVLVSHSIVSLSHVYK